MFGHDAIRLVVHGRPLGLVPSCVTEFVDRLQRQRKAPSIEVLTAEHHPASSSNLLWLILYPVPGNPCADRSSCDSASIDPELLRDLLPFLGAWPAW